MKYTKQQNGFISQELRKAFVKNNDREPTATEKNFIDDVGLLLCSTTNGEYDFMMDSLKRRADNVFSERKDSCVKELKLKIAKLEGCPECKSNNVTILSNEIVCKDCGLVFGSEL